METGVDATLALARIKAQRELDLAIAAHCTQEHLLQLIQEELACARTRLQQLRPFFDCRSPIPVNYVAGLNFVAEVHQRVLSLQIRSTQLEQGLEQEKRRITSLWRRTNMLDEHRSDRGKQLRVDAQRRVAVELDAYWLSRPCGPKGAA